MTVRSLGEPDLVERATAPGWRRARPLGRRGAALGAADVRALAARPACADRSSAAAPSLAGAREGWAYVWPRDAGAVALAFAAAGLPRRSAAHRSLPARPRPRRRGALPPRRQPGRGTRRRRVTRAGWVAAAARAAGLRGSAGRAALARPRRLPGGRRRATTSATRSLRGRRLAYPPPSPKHGGLVREAGDPDSGLDSAAAWAVRPFPRPALFRPLVAPFAAAARRAQQPLRHRPLRGLGRRVTIPGPPPPPGPPGASPRWASAARPSA